MIPSSDIMITYLVNLTRMAVNGVLVFVYTPKM